LPRLRRLATVVPVSTDRERLEVGSVEELRGWLSDHHETSPGVWLVRWKKGRGPYIPYPEIVRELLCVGWIDGQARGLDDDRSLQLVCPRRPGGGWSRVNKQHLEELYAAGRMLPAGVAAVDRARADGSWTRLDEVETLREPDDLRAALDAVPAAREAWDGFPRSPRRAILEWISSAKREATRARRVAETVSEAAAGRRANQPGGR
jgi:uncharacterized protein YdeI (YjbR/CyaY-like superfamily)